jgi:hypothetical protein
LTDAKAKILFSVAEVWCVLARPGAGFALHHHEQLFWEQEQEGF